MISKLPQSRRIWGCISRRILGSERIILQPQRDGGNLRFKAHQLSVVEGVVTDRVQELGIFGDVSELLRGEAISILALFLFLMTMENLKIYRRRDALHVYSTDVFELIERFKAMHDHLRDEGFTFKKFRDILRLLFLARLDDIAKIMSPVRNSAVIIVIE